MQYVIARASIPTAPEPATHIRWIIRGNGLSGIGPAEYFTLMLFAMTAVASLAGASPAKGMLSAVLGLMIATIDWDALLTAVWASVAGGVGVTAAYGFAILGGVRAVFGLARNLSAKMKVTLATSQTRNVRISSVLI